MTRLVDQALALAATGLPVFPCAINKQPCIPKHEGGCGFRDATNEPNEVVRLFAHPAARLIGVPTGAASDIDVVDVDYRHAGGEWERANADRIPETRVHQTQSGGRHYLFRAAPRLTSSQSRIARGIDVRAEGGYIVHPPSPGYSIISDAGIACWPDWLLDQARPEVKPRPVSSSVGSVVASSAAVKDRAVRAFVERVLATVCAAPEGAKHTTLRDAARLLGGVAHRGAFSDEAATQWLLGALPSTVRDWENARRTALWALARGREAPVEPPEAPISRDEARAISRFVHRALSLGRTPADAWPDVAAFADQLGVGPRGARNVLDHCIRTREAS